ncbi:MAG: nitrate reductase molybdenum cofactor assembly chaperone [Curvibacter lanceolatus]|nr:nitrate reductase molybdenum cofactor assembly chaperone [Curvibacter lanceolatus]MBV5291881.1 nitrate reductase molybdenum cofactor assembly chaperone [Curvibacter lanceolatus]
MSTAHNTPARSLRALAHLLTYPDAALRQVLPEIEAALQQEAALSAEHRAGLLALTQALQSRDPLEVEGDYVDLFDRGRATSLHLFEHVHGDSRDRGPAMIDLLQTYEQGGLYLDPARTDGELPDHLPVVLEFASTLAPQACRDFIGEFAHILNSVHDALNHRQSPYAVALAAVLALGGQALVVRPLVAEPAMDESWAEPEAFAGCSSPGQQNPGQSQPIHFMPLAGAAQPRGALS